MAGPGGETHHHRHLRLMGFAKELNPSYGRGLIIRWPQVLVLVGGFSFMITSMASSR
jgi:hypothetical protein